MTQRGEERLHGGSGFGMRKFVAPEFVFGDDARFLAGRYARNYGIRKALVVTDPGVLEAGWTEQVLDDLAEGGTDTALFSGITSNPPAEEVMAGAARYAEEGCNGIVAVGGGSPMDCAKGIGIISSAPATHILDYEGVDRVEFPAPPLICIPTTAGTSADISQFAIITDLARKLKVAIVSKAIVPDVALIDPIPTATMSAYHTACTGLDALCHGIESFVSLAHSPVTDLHAREALRLVWDNLIPALESPRDLRWRGPLMLATVHAGLAFSNASLGAVHALAHSLGGFVDVAHGEANALLLPAVIGLNFETVPQRYALIAETLGVASAAAPPAEVRQALVEAVASFVHRAGIDRVPGTIGLRREDLAYMAENALRDPCMVTNPVQPRREEVEALYATLL